MTPAESREFQRLLKKVASLETLRPAECGPLLPAGTEPRKEPVAGVALKHSVLAPCIFPAGTTPLEENRKPLPRRRNHKSTRGCFPSERLEQTVKQFTAKQRRTRGESADAREEHVQEKSTISHSVTARVVLWPEYSELEDGDVLAHVEVQYKPVSRKSSAPTAPRWKLLAAARRAQRRLRLRFEALAHCGPPALFRKAGVYARTTGRETRLDNVAVTPGIRTARLELVGGSIAVDEPRYTPPMVTYNTRQHGAEIIGFAVQAAAHARGSLYIDTIHTSHGRSKRPAPEHKIVDDFMDWLALLGMPLHEAMTLQVLEYEETALAEAERSRDRDLAELVAALIGSAAQDVTFGALASTLSAASMRSNSLNDDDDDHVDEDEAALLVQPAADLADFCLRAYEATKNRAIRFTHRESARPEPSHDDTVLSQIATLIVDDNLDLVEIFLDATQDALTRRAMHTFNKPDAINDIRISFQDLRRGLWRLLACLPCDDHLQYH